MNESIVSHDGPGHGWLASLAPRGVQLGLERVREVLERLGRPDGGRATVIVAGTNGKGSVAAMLSAMLARSGRRVGQFTSPHLQQTRERVRVDGRCVSAEALDRYLAATAQAAQGIELTPFEALTAAAHLAFREAQAEVAVLEVGLGGRFDATNATGPDVSVVASLALDHMEILGESLDVIAREKLGVARDGRPCVVADLLLAEAAIASLGIAPRIVGFGREFATTQHEQAPDLGLLSFGYVGFGASGGTIRAASCLPGAHQADNAALAMAAYTALAEERSDLLLRPLAGVAPALLDVPWPLRLEVLDSKPLLVADGAHNAAGAERLARSLGEARPAWHVLLSVPKNRDPVLVVEELEPVARAFWIPRLENDRLWSASDLGDCVSAIARGADLAVGPPEACLSTALELSDRWDGVCVTGSLHALGEWVQRGLLHSPRLDAWLGDVDRPQGG